jgi:hypothetical protein
MEVECSSICILRPLRTWKSILSNMLYSTKAKADEKNGPRNVSATFDFTSLLIHTDGVHHLCDLEHFT